MPIRFFCILFVLRCNDLWHMLHIYFKFQGKESNSNNKFHHLTHRVEFGVHWRIAYIIHELEDSCYHKLISHDPMIWRQLRGVN